MEDLRDWAEVPVAVRNKAPLYVSKFNRKKKEPQVVNIGDQGNQEQPTRRRRQQLKPPVPKRNDVPATLVPTKKNFVVINAVENILAEPRRRHVETNKTTKKSGELPNYLKRFNHERQLKRDELLAQQAEEQRLASLEGSEVGVVQEEERLELVDKLKEKWDVINHKYQVFASHHATLDTQGKKQMKAKYERELTEIEMAIRKIDKGPLKIVRDN